MEGQEKYNHLVLCCVCERRALWWVRTIPSAYRYVCDTHNDHHPNCFGNRICRYPHVCTGTCAAPIVELPYRYCPCYLAGNSTTVSLTKFDFALVRVRLQAEVENIKDACPGGTKTGSDAVSQFNVQGSRSVGSLTSVEDIFHLPNPLCMEVDC